MANVNVTCSVPVCAAIMCRDQCQAGWAAIKEASWIQYVMLATGIYCVWLRNDFTDSDHYSFFWEYRFLFLVFFILFWGLWFHEHVLIYCILLFSGNLMCFSLEFQILPLLWVYWIFTMVWMLIVCENHKALLCPALLLHLIKKGCSGARSPAHTISVFSTSNKPKDSIFWSRRSLFFTSKNTNKLGQRFLTTLFTINLIMV